MPIDEQTVRPMTDAERAVVNAALALLERLAVVHESDDYKSVWQIAQLHRGPYAGPTYTAELAALRTAADALTGKP